MICTVRWDDLGSITQVWDVTIQDKCIRLLITMTARDNVNIYNERTGVHVSKNYGRWSTGRGETGDIDYSFPGIVKGVSVKNNKCQVLSVEQSTGKGTNYPRVIFHSLTESSSDFVSLYVMKESGFGMSFLKADQSQALRLTPGEYIYFKGEISIDSGYAGAAGASESPADEPVRVTVNKGLDVAFQDGSLHLFWDNREITKGLGIYTSFCVKQLWYDSRQALWHIDRIQPHEIRVSGRWPWIPIRQSWHVRLDGKKNRIFWHIENEVYRSLVLDAEEVNVLLTDDYQRWFAGNRRGRFYSEFSKSDLFRFRLWVSQHIDEWMGVRHYFFRLPSVSIRGSSKVRTAYSVIENANVLGENGRLLQYLTIPTQETSLRVPGRYSFFRCVLQVK
jgi:hypothetical protein